MTMAEQLKLYFNYTILCLFLQAREFIEKPVFSQENGFTVVQHEHLVEGERSLYFHIASTRFLKRFRSASVIWP
jgi:hypothetical protein